MKLGLLPLFRPESFSQGNFTATGLEYFSANALGEVAGFIQASFPEIQLCMRLALNEMLRLKPDLVILWATSSAFGQVQALAESFKTYLGIQVWLAGPHISYLPQSLPPDVDLGIIGEVELPLQQLLSIFLKQADAGPMHYRRVPGIIYQSKGRIYSGSPAQILPSLSQLPQPNYRLFLDLPGFSAPVIRSARVSDNLITALAYPPSRKIRLLHPEHLCQQISQIGENYRFLYKSFPFPPEHLHLLSPVFIPDYQFVQHRQRLEALIPLYLERNLHRQVFLIPNLTPELIQPDLIKLLKIINTRKIMLLLGPFGHTHPLLANTNPDQLEQALLLCKEHQIGVIGTLFLNPEVSTNRRQLAQTYLFVRDYLHYFEKLHVTALGVFPGTPVWEQFAAKTRPDAQALADFPWASLDWEKFSSNLPLYHTHLDRQSLGEVYQAFRHLTLIQDKISQPLQEDTFIQSRERLVKQFAKQYLKAEERILEAPLLPEIALKPLLPDYQIEQLEIRNGELKGKPSAAVDMIILSGTLTALKDPAASLKQLMQWLKPGGRVYIHWLNPLNLPTLVNFLKWQAKHSRASQPNLKYIKEEEMKALLKDCGLEVIETDYTIMEGVEAARSTVETLAARLEYHASMRIPQHMLYVSEIKILAKNRS